LAIAKHYQEKGLLSTFDHHCLREKRVYCKSRTSCRVKISVKLSWDSLFFVDASGAKAMNNPDGRSNLNGEESHVFDAGQQLQQQSLPGTSGAPFSGLSLTLPHQILALQRLFALNRNGVSGAAASAIPSAAMAQQNHQHSQQQYSQQHQSTTPTETNSSAVLLAPAVDTSVKSWFESPDKKPLRSGKWIPEEEEYAEILIELFNKGFIDDCENGTTLRLYLSRKLRCAPMRISKKYAGKGIGKIVYSHTGKIPVVLKGKLQHAEKKYLDAVGSIYGFCSVS
jgi:hypothetical protein